MKEMGYGEDYKYAHDYPDHYVEQQNLPDTLKDKKFYNPGKLGYEKQVGSRLKAWWRKKSQAGNEEPLPEIENELDEENQ